MYTRRHEIAAIEETMLDKADELAAEFLRDAGLS
jgi:hypothetical protein